MGQGGSTGRTIMDLVWPNESHDFEELAEQWGEEAVEVMMAATWSGYRDLSRELVGKIDKDLIEEELERTISQLLEPYIRTHLSGEEPYFVQHGCYEFATRMAAPAQPPQYDIAFVLIGNRKVMWPLEAKVIRTERNIARYTRDVRDQFLTGRYAPYVKGGAMLGYLFSGSSVNVLNNIAQALACSLGKFRSFDPSEHRVSSHVRNLEDADFASGEFYCHHLIMAV